MTTKIDGTAGVTYPLGDTQASGAGRLVKATLFTLANTGQTFTPDTQTKSVVVEAVGGGGAGGGAAATTAAQVSCAAGGSAGSYGVGRYTTGFSGVTLTVGAAGAGATGGAGGNGGLTSFGALLSCPGGPGATASGAAANTLSSIGSFTAPAVAPTGANLKAVAGASAQAPALLVQGLIMAGSGGNSPLGTGGAGVGAASGANNADAAGFGAGGGGAANGISQAARAGGNGSAGAIIVWEYV